MRSRLASVLLSASLLTTGVLLLTPNSRAESGAAATAQGTGDFAGLQVSVSQTTNLIDQVVEISWTGAAPTEPTVGSFDRDYLQIMQCWGDDPAGPAREQCQFGGLVGDSRGGNFVASRQANYGSTLRDPQETVSQAAGSLANVNIPFTSVGGRTVSTTLNEFYDASSTNELPFARTHADGTGREFFEVETAREAPGLGCGEPLTDPATGVRKGRACWLAIVPRGDREVDGAPRSGGDRLVSSPLSASNWAHRIVVPLGFQPIGINCPIGSAERRTVGQESIAEAISHWQPSLCQQSGAVYGFSAVGDDLARAQLRSSTPGLVFTSQPLPADGAPPLGAPIYAPVAVSGLTFAFNIESKAGSKAADDLKQHDGERLSELNLSARLVAKLLTQTYQLSVYPAAPSVAGNPPDLLRDPDFLALNPVFKSQFLTGLSSPLEPLGLTDAYAQLWAWVGSDADARAFLRGTPDPWGTTVNPNYKNLDLPRADLPKSDPYCADVAPNQPPLCGLDNHPYAANLHEAARAASRGDTLSRASYDPTATPPSYKKGLPQLSGSKLVLAITDTASAERYRLPTAKLLNAAGSLVRPTTTSLLAGEKAMVQTATAGVLTSNPRTTSAAAYPLTSLTYAATVPSLLDAPSRKDYAALLRYAAGAGQLPGSAAGQLPAGYAPLPAALREQALRAAALVATGPAARTGPRPLNVLVPKPVRLPPRVTGGGVSAPVRTATAPSTTGDVLPPIVVRQPPTSAAPVAPVPATALSRGLTRPVPVGASRFLVGVTLLLGAGAAVGGPLLTRLAARSRGDARA